MLKCSELKQMVKNNGGFSVNTNGDSPKSGYMVSIRDLYKIDIDLIDQSDIDFASNIANQVNGFIGGWLDVNDTNINNFYMDISINIQNKEKAIELAKQNNQLAIYDVSSGESIYL